MEPAANERSSKAVETSRCVNRRRRAMDSSGGPVVRGACISSVIDATE
jgi:hypothetical protein